MNPVVLGFVFKNVPVTRRGEFQWQRNELVDGVRSLGQEYGNLAQTWSEAIASGPEYPCPRFIGFVATKQVMWPC